MSKGRLQIGAFVVLVMLLPGVGGSNALAQCPQTKLTASDAACGQYFGIVAVDGEILVVGAPDAAISAELQPGAAYVFRRQGSEWSEQQKLIPSDSSPGDVFGGAVAISGTAILVGAHQQSALSDRDGAAYVFRRNGTQWVQEQELVPSDPHPLGHFGLSVSIVGNVIAVGSNHETFGGGDESGAVYVFRYNGAAWVQEQKFRNSDAAPFGGFGGSLSTDGDLIIAGGAGQSAAGAVYVFRWNGVSWTQEHKLTALDASPGDFFGSSVSIWKDVILVGADGDQVPELGSGSAYVFRRANGTWLQEEKLISPDHHQWEGFGRSVAIRDGLAVVGAPGGNPQAGVGAGALYVFQRADANWLFGDRLIASDADPNDGLGSSVGVDGCVVVAGAPGNHDLCPKDPFGLSGAVYVFDTHSCLNCIPAASTLGLALLSATLLLGGVAILKRRVIRPGASNVHCRERGSYVCHSSSSDYPDSGVVP